MPPAGVVLEDLVVPADDDAPGGETFREVVALGQSLDRHTWGSRDFEHSPIVYRQMWADARERSEVIVAREAGRVVGYAAFQLPLEDETHLAWAIPRVAPDARGRGVGELLAAELERRVEASGRSTVMSFSLFSAADLALSGERVSPASGSGSLPAAAPAVRLAQRHGLALELVNIASRTDLRALDLDALEPPVPEGYRLVSWHDGTPEQYVEDVAALYSFMSTGVPQGGLELTGETWDAERVRRQDARVAEQGRTAWVTAVEHAGRLVAFTVLYTDPARAASAEQEETGVLAPHRGRRLGMLVKAANARAALAALPELERAYTWNAAENEHMLAINRAFGYAPAGGSGIFQRVR